MIKNISIFACLLSLYSVCAFAAKSDGEAFRADWGLTGSMPNVCHKAETDEEKKALSMAMWGKDLYGWNHHDWRYNWLRTRTEYSAEYYVAHTITSNGAYFCKTLVAGDRGGCTHKPYTTYWKPNNTDDCFWLCADGYSGPGCTKPGETTECTQDFSANDMSGIQQLSNHTKGDDNIEDSIPMFFNGEYHSCYSANLYDRINFNSAKKQEHDVVLVIHTIQKQDGGKLVNIVVQPMTVRAGAPQGCEDAGDSAAWPVVSFAGTKKTLCPVGWKHVTSSNGTGTVCSNETPACDFSDCETGVTGYDSSMHDMTREGTTCKFRCKENNAFTSDTDFTCTPCPAAGVKYPQLYYVDDNGLCAACKVGEFLNKKDDGTIECLSGDTVVGKLTKTQLQKGDKTNVSEECWTKETLNDYKGCVTGKCSNGTEWKCDGACEAGFTTCPT